MVLSACGLLFVSRDEQPTFTASASGGFSQQPVEETSISEPVNVQFEMMDIDNEKEKEPATTEKRKRSESDDRDGSKIEYQCDKCEKKYYRWSHLVRHARNHSSEKRYSCPTCHKSFSRVDVMKRHSQKHSRNSKPPQPPLFTTKLCAPFDANHNPMFQPSTSSSNNKKGNNRVSKACKACSLAKIRCSEMKPCKSCVDKGLNCAVVQDDIAHQTEEKEDDVKKRVEREIEEKIAKCLSITRNRNETIRTPRHPGCPWGFAPLVWPPDEEDADATPKPATAESSGEDILVPDTKNDQNNIKLDSSLPPEWEGADPVECGGSGIGGILRISHPTDASAAILMKRNPIREAILRSAMSRSNTQTSNKFIHPCVRESSKWPEA